MISLQMFLVNVFAKLGVDISYYQGDVSQESFQCLAEKGYEFAIIQVYSKEIFNKYVKQQYERAKNVFKHVDLYIFTSIKYNPREQVREALQRLRDAEILDDGKNARIWVDIENKDIMYPVCADNQWYYTEVIEELISQIGRDRIGIYSNKYEWNGVFPCTWMEYGDIPLWFARFDGVPSLTDGWLPFGPFTAPVIKQYTATEQECGVGIDHDYAEGFYE